MRSAGTRSEKTVRSYENRLRQFVRWTQQRDDVETIRDIDGWIVDEYERFLDERGDAPATVKGKMVALKERAKYCAQLEVADLEFPDRVEIPRLAKDDQTDDTMLASEDARRLIEYYRESTSDYGTVQHVLLELTWHIGAVWAGSVRSIWGDWHPDEQKLTFRHRSPTEQTVYGLRHTSPD